MWAIILCETNQLIGMIGLTDLVIENDKFVELSYRLHPAFWKKGYALEATTSLIIYAFTKLNLENVFAFIEPANVNSKVIAEKLGMNFKKQILFHDKVIDVYQLTNKSFEYCRR